MACVYEDLDQFYLIYYYDMEKLLQLLNEYRLEKELPEYTKYISKTWYFTHKLYFYEHYSWVISKKFWFIERLVNKDRINYYKVGEIVDTYKWSLREKAYVVEDCTVESMLMLLSIQDDPISFLISVLK